MRNGARIAVIIPALNEEQSIGKVLDAIPHWVDQVVVVDNGSTDGTAKAAANMQAKVVFEPVKGYGAACHRGIVELDACDVVVFLDADFSDYPEQMERLVDPILEEQADMVIGSRRLGSAEKGALTPQQRAGNALACALIRMLWGVRYTDLGPFRAIRYSTLFALGMRDRGYGWTVEMQVRAAARGHRVREVPVDYRRRIGNSKISGTLKGTILAGYTILRTIFSIGITDLLGLRAGVRRRLVIFTRYPTPGETKTRLIPSIGPEEAAELHRVMTEHAVRNARSLMGAEIEIRFTGADETAMQEWLGNSLRYQTQGDGDLGTRMKRAFQDAFQFGIDQTVIIGTDCPDLSPAVLADAFDRLNSPCLALGPAVDGGYYLIGLHRNVANTALSTLFGEMFWGTSRVYAETLARAAQARLPVEKLVPLRDIDQPEDIEVWESRAHRPRISVIIPALNEAAALPATIRAVTGAAETEVIVVDGGSTDETPSIAAAHGLRVVDSPRGRAIQMNLGSAWAAGEHFLFLHADTLLPPEFDHEVERILANPSVSLGAFRFATDDARWSMRVIGRLTNFRARWLKLPYGDQAIFTRREDFRGLGGFPELSIMEDFAFVRKASNTGRIALSKLPATTSARRWRRLGPWRTLLYNQMIILGYACGISTERLAAFYRRAKN